MLMHHRRDGEVVGVLIWREGVDPLPDSVPKVVDGVGVWLSQEGPEVGVSHASRFLRTSGQ